MGRIKSYNKNIERRNTEKEEIPVSKYWCLLKFELLSRQDFLLRQGTFCSNINSPIQALIFNVNAYFGKLNYYEGNILGKNILFLFITLRFAVDYT
jgi:hypothetical protein